ncbi:MAG: adenylosuccinate synthetase, partial [Pirellulales bacterium]
LDEVQMCTDYRLDGRLLGTFPSHVEALRRCEPVYRTLPGWPEDLSGTRRLDDLPGAARKYVDTIEELVGVRVEIVSIGPDRRETIFVDRQQVAAGGATRKG